MIAMQPWTHSKLDTFQTCPRKFEAEYVTKTVPYTESAMQAYGNRIHKSFEEYFKGVGLPEDLRIHQPMLDTLSEGELIGVEIKGALTTKLRAIDVDKYYKPLKPMLPGEHVWWRGVVDHFSNLGLFDGRKRCRVADYKSSKQHNKTDQLKEYALWAFARGFDECEVFYYWTQTKETKPRIIIPKEQAPKILEKLAPELAMYAEAHRLNIFNPKKNGLCRKWCGVKDCEFWGG